MASILVVGQEQRSLERFHRVLSAEGWRVRVAQGRAQALQAAALEPPDLVLAGAEMPGAEELAGAFRRSAGGPGIVVVMPESGLPTGPAVLGDDRLRLPFGDNDLVLTVRRLLAVAREAGGPAAPPVRLTVRAGTLPSGAAQFASRARAVSFERSLVTNSRFPVILISIWSPSLRSSASTTAAGRRTAELLPHFATCMWRLQKYTFSSEYHVHPLRRIHRAAALGCGHIQGSLVASRTVTPGPGRKR